jgi:hypothetical protein
MPHPKQATRLFLSHLDGIVAFGLLELLLFDEEDGGEGVGLRLVAAVELPGLGEASEALGVALQCVSLDKLPSHNYIISKPSVRQEIALHHPLAEPALQVLPPLQAQVLH